MVFAKSLVVFGLACFVGSGALGQDHSSTYLVTVSAAAALKTALKDKSIDPSIIPVLVEEFRKAPAFQNASQEQIEIFISYFSKGSVDWNYGGQRLRYLGATYADEQLLRDAVTSNGGSFPGELILKEKGPRRPIIWAGRLSQNDYIVVDGSTTYDDDYESSYRLFRGAPGRWSELPVKNVESLCHGATADVELRDGSRVHFGSGCEKNDPSVLVLPDKKTTFTLERFLSPREELPSQFMESLPQPKITKFSPVPILDKDVARLIVEERIKQPIALSHDWNKTFLLDKSKISHIFYEGEAVRDGRIQMFDCDWNYSIVKNLPESTPRRGGYGAYVGQFGKQEYLGNSTPGRFVVFVGYKDSYKEPYQIQFCTAESAPLYHPDSSIYPISMFSQGQ